MLLVWIWVEPTLYLELLTKRGSIKSQTVISTKAYPDFADYVKASIEALQPALDTVGGLQNVRAMGIGAPNGNYYSGTIEYAANLAWPGVIPAAQMFEDALGIPAESQTMRMPLLWAK